MAEGARFEASTGPETIGRDRISLVRSQSLAEDIEEEENLIKTDRAR